MVHLAHLRLSSPPPRCDGDATRFKDFEVRFSGVVYPGETIVTDMWDEGSGRLIIQARTAERGEAVISNAAATVA